MDELLTRPFLLRSRLFIVGPDFTTTGQEQAEHAAVREQGRVHWYQAFTARTCKVERDYAFGPH